MGGARINGGVQGRERPEMTSFGRVSSVVVTFDDGSTVTVPKPGIIHADVEDWRSPSGQDFNALLTLRLEYPADAQRGRK